MEAILNKLDSLYHLVGAGEIRVYQDNVNNRLIYLDLNTYNLEITRPTSGDQEITLYGEVIFNKSLQEIGTILNTYL